MQTFSSIPHTRFAYQKTKPFSNAECKFRFALADYAAARLLAKLQNRTAGDPAANQYTGISTRLAEGTVYLQAILTHDSEWGGFCFDFARLYPVEAGGYNFSVRRPEDWIRAEQCTIASASAYFMATALAPRASDWVRIARGKSFEECIEELYQHLPPEPACDAEFLGTASFAR